MTSPGETGAVRPRSARAWAWALGGLAATVQGALEPAHVSVWLAQPSR